MYFSYRNNLITWVIQNESQRNLARYGKAFIYKKNSDHPFEPFSILDICICFTPCTGSPSWRKVGRGPPFPPSPPTGTEPPRPWTIHAPKQINVSQGLHDSIVSSVNNT